MPIEIKELVIRTVVEQAGEPFDYLASTGMSSGGPSPQERTAIVEAAVKEVLRILRAAKER